jgi:hypothetical protein
MRVGENYTSGSEKEIHKHKLSSTFLECEDHVK